MSGKVALTVLLLLVTLIHVSVALSPTSPYASGPIALTDTTTLYHEANAVNDSIRLAIIIEDAATVGPGPNWLGMGIGESTSGSMIGADIVTAQFAPNASTTCSIQDRYVPFVAYPLGESPSVFPYEDDCARPDWQLVSCVVDVANGVMMLEVTRSLSVADGKQDRAIVPGRNAFLHAYGNVFSYHGKSRHSAEVIFYEEPNSLSASKELPDDVDGSFIISATAYEIPNDRSTVYACTSIPIPGIGNGTEMIVAAEPLISSDNADNVHHFTLYMCSGADYARRTKKTVACDTGETSGPVGNPAAGCSTLVFGYAKGASRFVYPPDVGVVVRERYPYLVMETHFDNPGKTAGLIDHSGIRVYYTSTKRKHSSGSLLLGDGTVSRAPGTVRNGFRYQHSCPSECTSRFSQNITIFSSFLHMHRTGREIYTNIYDRNDKFVQNVNKVNFWSDNFQKFVSLSKPAQLQPGDQLHTVCQYDTTKRPNTVFGIATKDEMCVDFLLYWPVQTDPVTGHEFNICSFEEFRGSTSTLCGDAGKFIEMFAENATGFPLDAPNPALNDTTGAPTEFGTAGAICVTPLPQPTESGEKDPVLENIVQKLTECFPAFATVRKRDGSKVRMDALSIGDVIEVGDGQFSAVFMFTHADANAFPEMISLKTERHGTLTLSKGHFVYANRILKPARLVNVGEALRLADGGEAKIVSKEFVRVAGLFNPQTLHGDIAVDGFVASTFTEAVKTVPATALLAPLRWAFSAFNGVYDIVSEKV